MAESAYDIPGVLESVKKFLGLDKDYDAFDSDITMHINSVFNILNQLGVGPDDTFTISGYDQNWSSFTMGNANITMVKSFVFSQSSYAVRSTHRIGVQCLRSQRKRTGMAIELAA